MNGLPAKKQTKNVKPRFVKLTYVGFFYDAYKN